MKILLYHIIDDAIEDKIALKRSRFQQHLLTLRAEGYTSIRLGEYIASLNDASVLPEKPVLITFDDGYIDFYDAAAPMLLDAGFHAVQFLITDPIGTMNWWNTKARYLKAHLSWNQIRELSALGFEFGAHSTHHHSLVKLDEAQIYSTLYSSKHIIELETGLQIDAVSYPYGDINDKVLGIASQLFKVGFSVTQGDEANCNRNMQINRHFVISEVENILF